MLAQDSSTAGHSFANHQFRAPTPLGPMHARTILRHHRSFEPVRAHGALAGQEPPQLKPNAEHLREATAAAAVKAGTVADSDFVYEALTYMRGRVVLLEEVRHIASRFMHAGQDQTLHSALRKALDAVNGSEELDTAPAAQLETKGMLL